MIRVVVADDHHLVRQGIRALLERADDIEVVGEAENGQEAVELVESFLPDVAVMDISMQRLNGILATERIRAHQIPTHVLILSMHADNSLVREALLKGAIGYLLKRSITEELLLAVRAASRGEIYLSPSISDSVLLDLSHQDDVEEAPLVDRLTPREREVLQLIAGGKTNRGIAEAMTISVKTVEKHRANLMSKLEVHDLPALMRTAIKHNLVILE